jgi:ribosomal protein S18 acetylase RimI-like enzyme
VRFEGFDQPVASIVAEDEDAFNKLLAQVRGAVSTFVFASGLEHVPVKLRSSVVSTDMWMVAPCLLHRERPDPDIERLEDVSELQSFLLRMGMNFWNPAMLRFGHTFGIRSKDLLVCAAGVNFILSDESYAQIGPVVTDPAQRGKSMATRLLDTIRSSLAEAGIGQCGVFVSETDKDVVAFYGRRGFMRRGQFWLLKVTEDQPSF